MRYIAAIQDMFPGHNFNYDNAQYPRLGRRSIVKRHSRLRAPAHQFANLTTVHQWTFVERTSLRPDAIRAIIRHLQYVVDIQLSIRSWHPNIFFLLVVATTLYAVLYTIVCFCTLPYRNRIPHCSNSNSQNSETPYSASSRTLESPIPENVR